MVTLLGSIKSFLGHLKHSRNAYNVIQIFWSFVSNKRVRLDNKKFRQKILGPYEIEIYVINVS